MLFIVSLFIYFCVNTNSVSVRVLVCVFFLCCTYDIVIFCTLRTWEWSQFVSLDSYTSMLLLCVFFLSFFFLKYHNFNLSSNRIKLNGSTHVLSLHLSFVLLLLYLLLYHIVAKQQLCRFMINRGSLLVTTVGEVSNSRGHYSYITVNIPGHIHCT